MARFPSPISDGRWTCGWSALIAGVAVLSSGCASQQAASHDDARAEAAASDGSMPAEATPDPVEPPPDAVAPSTTEPTPTEPTLEMVEGPDGTLMPVLGEVEHEGGLIVQTLRATDGAACSLADRVTVHTHGTLAADGSVFWTTRGGEPSTFLITQLIQGWQLGLPGARVGEVVRLMIPAPLGYGAQDKRDAAGNIVIPAGSDLIFTIELIAIQ